MVRIPVVNEQDEILCYKEREETTREDIRRITSLFLFNEEGETLLARRHPNKSISPNRWGPAVEGTVDEGYDYDETIVKEMEEELGLKTIQPILISKEFYTITEAKRFCTFYYAVVPSDTQFILQESEVAEVRWISISDLKKWFLEKPEEFAFSFHIKVKLLEKVYEHLNQN
jgi:isopentenyl-diphosphate delta-isomerase